MGRALSGAGASATLRCSGTACEFGVICLRKPLRRKIVFVSMAGVVTTKGSNALQPRHGKPRHSWLNDAVLRARQHLLLFCAPGATLRKNHPWYQPQDFFVSVLSVECVPTCEVL
jgi:hypothetical protein